MQKRFLRRANRLAMDKMAAGEGGRFGALVVPGGQVVGVGWNRVTSTNDPTAHADIVAIGDACTRLGTFSLAECEMYTSCEPCPMCLAAIYWARIERGRGSRDGKEGLAFRTALGAPGPRSRVSPGAGFSGLESRLVT